MGWLRKLLPPWSREEADAELVDEALRKAWMLAQQEQTAEQKGNFKQVAGYLARLSDLEREAASDIFDIFINIRLLLLQHLHKLSVISMDVRRNGKITPEEKAQFHKEMEEYYKHMKGTVADIFQKVTNAETTATALQEHLQNLAAQTGKLCSIAKATKRAVLRTKSTEKRADSAARSDGAEFTNFLREYGHDLATELRDIEDLTNDALAVLKGDKQHTLNHAHHVRQLVQLAKFSDAVGTNLEREFHATAHYIDENLQAEVERQRKEVAEAQQLKAA